MPISHTVCMFIINIVSKNRIKKKENNFSKLSDYMNKTGKQNNSKSIHSTTQKQCMIIMYLTLSCRSEMCNATLVSEGGRNTQRR